jgi:hypothetical protein
MTYTLTRYGKTYSAADLRASYEAQLGELAAKVAAKPQMAASYMAEVERARGRADAMAAIEKEFTNIEVWAVEQHWTVADMLVVKFDTIAELALDAVSELASPTPERDYNFGWYRMVNDVWNTLRRDPHYPGNTPKE